jgi:Fe-S cluster assembly protein SufD
VQEATECRAREDKPMAELMEEKNVHLGNFARLEKESGVNGTSSVHRLRKAAIQRFGDLGFPTLRNEDWRFTNVAPLARIPFQLTRLLDQRTIEKIDVESIASRLGDCYRLVFVDGHHTPEFSATRKLPAGVQISSLARFLTEDPKAVEPHLGQYAKFQNHAFTALNTAFIQDGAFISVAPGVALDKPISLIYVSTGAAREKVAHPRNLILVGAKARASLVETYVGLEQEVYWTNVVGEIVLGEGAVVEHVKLQSESLGAFHVALLQVYQKQASQFSTHYIGRGGHLVRNEVRDMLAGEECQCTINGLYMAGGKQHLDNQTVLDHAMPRCTSHELYKGILDGKAHGVFNGKIFVHQDAQKTDAKQTNQTLLLSEDALVNTKPELEIYADDVKCTHGATVGHLDAEALFYLRARGIALAEARSLLTFAFANDIVERIHIEPLRSQLERELLEAQHLSQEPEALEAP